MLRLGVFVTAIFAVSLMALPDADARASRVSQTPASEASCGLCHVNPAGAGARTPFGETVNENLVGDNIVAATVDWPAVAALDSDGDGASNGAELGDASGEWMPGQPGITPVSDANDQRSTPDNPDVTEEPAAEPDGGGGGNTDEGCAVAPGAPTQSLGLMLLLGALVVLRRRKA